MFLSFLPANWNPNGKLTNKHWKIRPDTLRCRLGSGGQACMTDVLSQLSGTLNKDVRVTESSGVFPNLNMHRMAA